VAYTATATGGDVDDDVAASFADAVDVIRSLGADLVEAAPDLSRLASPFMTIATVAFAGMGSEMSDDELSLIGTKCLALMKRGWGFSGADYYAAQQAAYRESSRVLEFWREFDLLVTPTVPIIPPPLDQFPSTEDHDAKWAEYGFWETFTYPWNVTGQPAISLPCRKTGPDRLPVGIQLVGRPWAEALMLSLAAAYEAAAEWPSCIDATAASRASR
jgi:amidase/aspartyl-tRNA(Asn)/glutamyl-tRNA(Gln) amidotransferase subunit A